MTNATKLKKIIESAFSREDQFTVDTAPDKLKDALRETFYMLNRGKVRAAAPNKSGVWKMNEWIKKAILMTFQFNQNKLISSGDMLYYDKMQFKYYKEGAIVDSGVRVVPPATVRNGAYVAPGVVLMPSFVNVGAFIDSGTMVDTWATVGSCAQIGKNVHLSGGVGIGGVLEPLQTMPTIIEDDCFIGARSEVVEGVIIGKGSVLSMGVFIGQSTRIYDRATDTISYGAVPPGSVVVPGALPSEDGRYALNCAVIVKKVDAKTRAKTAINELLREEDE